MRQPSDIPVTVPDTFFGDLSGDTIVSFRHFYRFVRQDVPSLTLLKPRHRRVHAHLITLHQAGSHWLNHMLADCLQREYAVRELAHIRDRSIIGRPQDEAIYPHLPRIVQSHEIPSPLVHAWPVRALLRFPSYIVLVRDLRATLVSYYEKSKELEPFRMSFADFLRNERIIGNPIRRDLWNRIRFLNAWARDLQRLPRRQTLLMRYEDLCADPAIELQRIWAFLELAPHAREFFSEAVVASSKGRMSCNEHPGERLKVVRASGRHPFEWYRADDRAYFVAAMRRHLHNWFGYDYDDWTVPAATRPGEAA